MGHRGTAGIAVTVNGSQGAAHASIKLAGGNVNILGFQSQLAETLRFRPFGRTPEPFPANTFLPCVRVNPDIPEDRHISALEFV